MGDLVYIGSCVGTFFALDRQTGQVRWSYDIRQDGDQTSFHGAPIVIDDQIITGTDGTGTGFLYSFQLTSGRVRWKYRVTRPSVPSIGAPADIVSVGNDIFTSTFGDELVALDKSDGKLLWTFVSEPVNNRIKWPQSPAIAGDLVFFGAINGSVYALNARSGKEIWKQDLGSRVSTNLIVDRRDLYAGTADGYLFKLHTRTGEISSKLKLPTTPVGWPTLAKGSVLVYLNSGGGAGAAESLVSIDTDLKKIQWQVESVNNWSVTRPFIWQDSVLTGNERGEVRAYRLSDGNEDWSATFRGTVRSFGGAKDVIYIGMLSGTVYAYAP